MQINGFSLLPVCPRALHRNGLLFHERKNQQYLPNAEINTRAAMQTHTRCCRRRGEIYSFTFAGINYQSWGEQYSISRFFHSTVQSALAPPGYWARALHKKFSKYVIPCSAISFVCAASHSAPPPHTYSLLHLCVQHSTQGNLASPNYLNNFVLHWSGLHLCSTYATLSNALQASLNAPHVQDIQSA